MKYDFVSIIDRKGKDALAVDLIPMFLEGENPVKVREGFDMIPMWVADMNFPVLPTITDAIIERAKHPTFGYFEIRDEYYDSIIRWQYIRNGVKGIKKESWEGLRLRSMYSAHRGTAYSCMPLPI